MGRRVIASRDRRSRGIATLDLPWLSLWCAWRASYGAAPSSYDWSRTHARRRGGKAHKRLQAGERPAPSTVIDLYGSWAAGVADTFGDA